MGGSYINEERKIDLCSVKKIDNDISNILDKTDKVAYYTFDGSKWHKQDIQGSMFVFCRSIHPYYGFLIQNRKSLSDNVCEYLIDGIEFQRTNLFLLYKTQSSNVSDDARIRSIWFESEEGCKRISALLNRLLDKKNEAPKRHTPEVDSKDADILNLFEKARADFDDRNNKGSLRKGRKQKDCTRQRPRDRRSQSNDERGQNMLDMFKEAHVKYNKNKSQHGSNVVIMKRPKSNQLTAKPNQTKASQNKNSNDSRKSSGNTHQSIDVDSQASKSLKSIPITFQDLVNSVNQRNPGGDDSSGNDNLSSSELDTFDDFNDKEVTKSKPYSQEMSPTISSESDPMTHTDVKKTQDYSNNKLLLSPLDFLTTTTPSTATPCGSGTGGGRCNTSVLEPEHLPYPVVPSSSSSSARPSSARRVLFNNWNKTRSSPNKYSLESDDYNNNSDSADYTDLQKFKSVLIDLINEDDAFVAKLHSLYVQKNSKCAS